MYNKDDLKTNINSAFKKYELALISSIGLPNNLFLILEENKSKLVDDFLNTNFDKKINLSQYIFNTIMNYHYFITNEIISNYEELKSIKKVKEKDFIKLISDMSIESGKIIYINELLNIKPIKKFIN